jgi:hypothetical protein
VPDDRSDSDAAKDAASGGSRKPRAPIIELTATDVTPEQPASAGAKEDAAPKQEQARDTSRNAPPPENKRSPILFASLAGVIGLLAGALTLSLVVLFAGDGVKRLMNSATEKAANIASASDLSAVRERAEQIAKSQGEIEKRTSEVETKIKALDPAQLKTRLEAIEKGLADLKTLTEQTQNATATASENLTERLNALEARVKQTAARPAAANAAEVVALGALQDAIAKGGSFTKELGVVRAMLGEAGASLAPLEKFASSGIPTIAELRKRFAELAPKLAREPSQEGGYFSKLLSNAGRLVEVRPVGEVAGTSAGAVVARIETRLARNDLAAALDQAAQLPASAKAQAADWIASASRRREADTAVKNLMDAALANSVREPAK